jgi:hypothetical protein
VAFTYTWCVGSTSLWRGILAFLKVLERASHVLLSPILVSFLLLLKEERGKISFTLVNFRGQHVVPIPAVLLCSSLML